jgi:hypothetical protein
MSEWTLSDWVWVTLIPLAMGMLGGLAVGLPGLIAGRRQRKKREAELEARTRARRERSALIWDRHIAAAEEQNRAFSERIKALQVKPEEPK